MQWSFLTLEGWRHLALPALNLSLFKFAMMVRLARAGTREIMLGDTVKFARAAGLSEGAILRRHVLKLISIPIVTVFGLEFGSIQSYLWLSLAVFALVVVALHFLNASRTGRAWRALRYHSPRPGWSATRRWHSPAANRS